MLTALGAAVRCTLARRGKRLPLAAMNNYNATRLDTVLVTYLCELSISLVIRRKKPKIWTKTLPPDRDRQVPGIKKEILPMLARFHGFDRVEQQALIISLLDWLAPSRIAKWDRSVMLRSHDQPCR